MWALSHCLEVISGTTLRLTFWHIHMALHTYVAVCPCLFSSTQMWMFSWGWQHSCIVLVFLFDDTLWSPFLKFALNAILCKWGNVTEKQYYEMGTVHIIICNPIGKKSCTRIKFIADKQCGREVSGNTDVKWSFQCPDYGKKCFLKRCCYACIWMELNSRSVGNFYFDVVS